MKEKLRMSKRLWITGKLLLFLGLGGFADAHESAGQDVLDRKISLEMDQVEFRKVLDQIEDQADVRFIYSSSAISIRQKVSVKARNERLERVLAQLLEPVAIGYTLSGNRILLKNRSQETSRPPAVGSEPVRAVAPPDQTVAGTVTAADNGEPLPGVSVLVKGTQAGTTTDQRGEFSVNVPDQGAVLVFSFVGYVAQEVKVGSQTRLSVSLEADTKSLSEVVVVGYGSVKRKDITGSVSSISEQTIKQTPLLSADQALQGRAAGVQVVQTSGEPGAPISVRVRGGGSINAGNEPLFVVDGFPLTPGSSLNSFNPSDIESIEVLKDASATAIYGSRGANGVVLVTTKRGKRGKPVVSLESYYGQQTLRKKIPLLNARQFAELLNESSANSGKPIPFTSDQVAALGEGTDWQDELYRPAPITSHQLSVTGGSDQVRYAVSTNYFKQDGIVVNTGFDRISFRTNLDFDLSKRVKAGTSLTFARTQSRGVETQSDGRGVVANTLAFTPLSTLRDTDGNFTQVDIPQVDIKGNPVARTLASTDISVSNRLLANLFVDYKIIDNLTLRVSAGADVGYGKGDYYLPSTVYEGVPTNGYAQVSTNLGNSWLNENTLTYARQFGRSSLNVLAGLSLQKFTSENATARTQNFSNDILTYNNLFTGADPQPPYSGGAENSLRSYIGRVNYGFADRYLVTLTARADGSSRFGAGNKTALFPSGALAWRVSEEEFFKPLKFVSDLKLRVSAGVTGNQEIGNYQSLASLSPSRYVLGGGPNYAPRVGFTNDRVANPDLRWESTRQLDAGADLSLFGGRVSTTVDWYYKRTYDLLLGVPLPFTSGFTSALKNLGTTENRGLEWSVSSRNVTSSKGGFTWTTDLNLARNRNKVLDLGDVDQIFVGSSSGGRKYGNPSILRVGEPMGSFYGIVADGIFQSQEEVNNYVATLPDGSTKKIQPNAKPGDRRFQDLNNDGIINGSDRTIIGRAQPKFFGGITNTFGYKGLQLTVFMQGVYGSSVLNLLAPERTDVSGASGNQFATVLDRWTPTNPSNTVPRALLASVSPNIISSYMIENGSFLRFKTITLAYNLPPALLGRIGLGSIRLYVTGQNLITLNQYSGYDPEVNTFSQSNLSVNTDYGAYPTAKTILGGLNISF